MNLVTVVGARPQFVKAAAVSREIARRPEIREIIVHTGQHYDDNMSDVFFREMEIPQPKYNLNVNALGHGAMTGRMLEGLEEILLKERPELVMVYGDTNTTLAGALAAKKIHLKVVHVEAGLRSHNLAMPEEINRILTDRISDILCCPTSKALENLAQEGFSRFPCRIVKTGDVMQDAARYYAGKAARTSDVMTRLDLDGRAFALCTLHRAENTDDPDRLASIVAALNEISGTMEVVAPLHPRTAKAVETRRLAVSFTRIPPVGYFDMIVLLSNARIVLTDSGGVQKEAFFFGKPCVTMRDQTEWTELVDGGFNRLAGAHRREIVRNFSEMLREKHDFSVDLYGGGGAAGRIVDAILV